MGAVGKGERQLARLTVAATESMVVPVRDFVNRLLALQGFPDDQLLRLDLLVEEACLYVVQTAFDPGEAGDFDVVVLRRPNQIVIALEDRGLPRDLDEAAAHAETQLGLVLMRAFADEVIFHNLGKRGKRIELVKELPAASVAAQIEAEARPATGEVAVASDAVTLRLMTADDAMPLARCIYRSYGYTYGNDFVYQPAKVVELLDSGRLVSCVAVNEAGEVVGHLALQFAQVGAKVADSGIAVVDPRYRGRKLFEKMKAHMASWATANGVYGLVSEAVAVHPITQKGNLALGATETGLLLGYLPAGLEFRNIKGAAEPRRESAVMFYLRTNPEPERAVYPPPHHQAMIQRLYDKIPLRRTCHAAPPGTTLGAVRGQRSVIEQRLKPETSRAFIRIESYGGDVLELVHRHLRDLCLRKFDCVFLDLPLGDPLTAALCRAFEGLGFSVAAVAVEMCEGDSLRLLHLNNVDIDPDGLVVISDHGHALADYVLTARDAVGRLRSA